MILQRIRKNELEVCPLMLKRCLLLSGFLFLIVPLQVVRSETITKEDLYVTAEDIIGDLVMPTIDKEIEKMYGRNLNWERGRIEGIDYNSNHSYDVLMRMKVSTQGNQPFDYVTDEITLRISPSCDSEKINQEVCNHGFKIEVLDYKHLSQ